MRLYWKLPCLIISILSIAYTWMRVAYPDGKSPTGGFSQANISQSEGFTQTKYELDEFIQDAGHNFYKFDLPGVDGKEFKVIYRVIEAEGAEPRVLSQTTVKPTDKKPVSMRVSFTGDDGRLSNALFSNSPTVILTTRFSNCDRGACSTRVANPLKDLAVKSCQVFVSQSQSRHKPDNEFLLLRATGNSNEPEMGKKQKVLAPRVELLIVKSE